MRSMRGRRMVAATVLTLTGAIGLGACSSGDDRSAQEADRDPAVTTTTAAAVSDDATAICGIFNEIAAGRGGRGSQLDRAMTAEGWEVRIETTAKLVDAAPAEWKDEAETYLALVKDRAQLAAENGYVSVNELPADVRDAFIADHRDEQARANELIAFMGAECGATPAG